MLEYKALNIVKAEQKYGRGFIGFIGEMQNKSMGIIDVMFLLEAGGMSQDNAADMIDDKGYNEAVAFAMKYVMDAGFLGKDARVQKEVQEAKKALNTLENSGETPNA